MSGKDEELAAVATGNVETKLTTILDEIRSIKLDQQDLRLQVANIDTRPGKVGGGAGGACYDPEDHNLFDTAGPEKSRFFAVSALPDNASTVESRFPLSSK